MSSEGPVFLDFDKILLDMIYLCFVRTHMHAHNFDHVFSVHGPQPLRKTKFCPHEKKVAHA